MKVFNIKDKDDKSVNGSDYSVLIDSIQWMDTFTSVIIGFEQLDKIFFNLIFCDEYLRDDRKRNKNTGLRKAENIAIKNLDSNPKILNETQSAVKVTQAMYQTKIRAYTDSLKQDDNDVNSFVDRRNEKAVRGVMNDMVSSVSRLKGRGLRGAGVAPLEGVVRRGRTYKLNEIQGLATPSAYVYRQLGSKYIRIPDLDNKSLVIVQPNRRKCGPKRQIGEGLQSIIRTLTFKQHIDQTAYYKLFIDDKNCSRRSLPSLIFSTTSMTDSRTR
ncbi:unnamed protein product [Phytophthora lilii]|uniref:Unnamed protein product n=1 Tax=Phytophthora lilii TaxID=2077276 RepID=A0A9W6WS17_9STRA|nr:unnamed protein product [Phytophthora lilii]